MYSNNILNFQESVTILNACTKKKSGNLLKAPSMCKEDLTLNNLQWLICHKTQPNQTDSAITYLMSDDLTPKNKFSN